MLDFTESLIHRDYKSSTDVQIKIFDQKITFFNPGGLYGNITEEDLLTDTYQASTRNKQIAEAFYLTHDIEKYGSGFVRIRQAIANYPTMTFMFHEFGDGFVTEFNYKEQKTNTKGDIPIVQRIDNDLVSEILKKRFGKNWNVVENFMDTAEKTVEKTVEKILYLIEQNPKITQLELINITGLSRRGIEWNLAQLKQKGILVRDGGRKEGKWIVKQLCN
jgi:ATP-dependent DNA helicase RecG